MAATWEKIVFSGSAPQFTTIELGHASDTTISRTGAGDIAVEGKAIYRAGGTDVPVTDGGTGRSTGTTAYSLVATGTTATGAQQTLANGATTEVLVGGGASALPVWTTATGTGAPVRATSPTLTSIELGHASDTTLTRTGAGDIAVEGKAIYRAGGTDVPVTDGGTGASTLTDHGILLGSGTAAVTPLGAATNGQLPIGSTGADPVLAAITPGDGIDVTNAAGAITVAVDIKANGGLVIETTELAVNLGASAITGTLAVGDGGTGASTLTDHGVLLGSGTGPITPMTALAAGEILVGVGSADPHALAAGATTKILVGGGAADPVWTTATGSGAPVRQTSPSLTGTLGFAPATELTIAAGAVTATQVLHLIDTESDAASDDLVTINGGVNGLQLEIRAAHTDRTVVIKETGNILTGGSDIRLDGTNKYILFTYDGALSKWVVVATQNAVTFATAAEITAGTEPAKAIAPDQLALTKYNGDWSFWGIKNLRLIDVHAGDATRVIVNPSAYNIPLLIGEHWHVMTAGVDVDSVDDLDTGALAAGTDYYIYACTDGTTLSFKVSANATNPTGFDAAHSRKIGGFHTLCVAVGTISGHTLTGYAQKDILPASIWDLKHRAKNLVNVGLVYDSKIQKWVDIYLASGTGANTTSVNGGTISDTRNWMDFVDDGLAVGKRLLTDTEFTSIATGSNEETNITGSADPGTTSGHVDTASRRMISNIGCEDCCGVVWQWIQDQACYYYGATGYYGNLPGGKGSTYTQFAADPGASEVDNTDAAGDVKLFAGGHWEHAAIAGSRSRTASGFRWFTYSALGARFAVEPL